MADIPGQRKKPTGANVPNVSLPQYEQRTGYQPQAQSAGVGQAMANFSQAQTQISEFGNELAQRSSKILAQEYAREAAKIPGYKPLPEFTASGRAFEEVFYSEQKANIWSQANSLVQRNFNLAARPENLSPKGLEVFRDSTMQGLQKLLELSAPQNKTELERVFREQFESNYWQLQKSVLAKDREEERNSFFIQAEQQSEQIYNDKLSGNTPSADINLQQLKEEAYDKYDKGLIDEPELFKIIQEANGQFHGGQLAKEATEAAENRKEAEFLDNFEKSDKYSATEKLKYGKYIQNALSNYHYYHNSLEQIHAAEAKLMLAQGRLNNATLDRLAPGLSRLDELELRAQLSKQEAKLDKGKAALGYVAANKANPGLLNTMSSEERDLAANEQWEAVRLLKSATLGDPNAQLSVKEKAQALIDWPMHIPSLSKQISGAIKSGTVVQAKDAMEAQSFIANNNPWMYDHADKDSKAIADKFMRRRNFGQEEGKALEEAQNEVLKADINQRKDWKLQFTDDKKKKDWDTYYGQAKKIANAMGWSKGDIKPTFVARFMEQLENNFYGNWDDAVKNTVSAANTVWGIETFNGEPESFFMPLSRTTPLGEVALPAFRAQLREEISRLALRSKVLFDDRSKYPDIEAYYEILPQAQRAPKEKRPSSEVGAVKNSGRYPILYAGEISLPEPSRNLFEDRLKALAEENKEQIRIQKIDRSGKIMEGTLRIDTDESAPFPLSQGTVQYRLSMVVDGIPYPLYNPYTGENYVSWSPDIPAVVQQFTATEEEDQQRLEKAKEAAEFKKRVQEGLKKSGRYPILYQGGS